MAGLDLPQEVGAVHPGHPQVGDHHVEGLLGEGGQAFPAAAQERHVPGRRHGGQGRLEIVQENGVIIDEQNP